MNRYTAWKNSLSEPKQLLLKYFANAVGFAIIYTVFELLIGEKALSFTRVAFGGIFFSLFFTTPVLEWRHLKALIGKKDKN